MITCNKTMKLIMLAMMILLSACQKQQKGMVMQNSLRINFQEGDLPSLHPHDLMIYLRGISIGKCLFEGLTRLNEQGEVLLAGAESMEVSPDGLRYLFKLRKNYWSDGSPVKASQYEEAWKEALSPVSFCPRPDLLYAIKNARSVKKAELPLEQLGVQSLDDRTLRVELERPSPHFLKLLAQSIAAPLQHPSHREVKTFNGPFTLHQWDRNRNLTLKPNRHFWNAAEISLEEIEISMIQDVQTAFSLYEQNHLDWIGVPLCPLSAEQIESLKTKKALMSYPIDRAFWVFLNTTHQALSSPLIRKALSLAIDRELITHHVLIGNQPLVKPLPHALLPGAPQSALKEDVAEARRQFEQGLRELELTEEAFPPLVIAYSQQAGRKQLAEYLQDAWTRNLGIRIRLEPQEWNVLRTNMSKGQFEITGSFEASFCQDPLELLERMADLTSSNFPRWVFPAYQEKVALAAQEIDSDRRVRLLSEAEGILMDQMPFIPISSDRFFFAHHPKLKGYTFDSVGAIDFSYASMK